MGVCAEAVFDSAFFARRDWIAFTISAIIDKDVMIPPNTTIGYDLTEDRKHYTVSPEGIVVIPKKATI